VQRQVLAARKADENLVSHRQNPASRQNRCASVHRRAAAGLRGIKRRDGRHNPATMGQRLTQIATRTGDDGSTGLGDGTRVPKDHLRVQAMGDVDELNSSLGVLLAEPLPEDVRELLIVIQHELFNLGGELSIPGYELLKPAAVLRLDEALAHVSRTVARRAERALVALAAQEPVNEAPRQYLNRLSDLMFVLARVLNRANLDGLGGDDVYWRSERLARAGG